MTTDTNRRTVLKSAAGAAVVATALPGMALGREPEPLLVLWEKRNAVFREAGRLQDKADDLDQQLPDWARGVPRELKPQTRGPKMHENWGTPAVVALSDDPKIKAAWQAYVDCATREHRELIERANAERDRLGITALEQQASDKFAEGDAIEEEIQAAKPSTVAGLAVQAFLLAYLTSDSDTWKDGRDWKLSRAMADNLQAQAGIKLELV